MSHEEQYAWRPSSPAPYEPEDRSIPPHHSGNQSLQDPQIVAQVSQRRAHPYWQAFGLTLARVVNRDPLRHTVDVIMQDGGLVEGVKVVGLFGSMAGEQYIPPQKADVPMPTEYYGSDVPLPVPTPHDLWAVIGFLKGNAQQPVCLGFLGSFTSQLYASTPGISLSLHESGVYHVTLPDGHDEFHWPDGSYLVVSSSGSPHNMASENPDWNPPTVSTAMNVTLKHATGAEITISSTGAITVTPASGQPLNLGGTGGKPVAREGDTVSVTVSGTQYTGTITSGSSTVQSI